MNKYYVLYHHLMNPKEIIADCVCIENDYTEFILNHEVIARFYKCVMWEKINEN